MYCSHYSDQKHLTTTFCQYEMKKKKNANLYVNADTTPQDDEKLEQSVI